jgi:hypothetical protein
MNQKHVDQLIWEMVPIKICYQGMLDQLGMMNNHLECLTQYQKQSVVEVLHSTSEEMKKHRNCWKSNT